MKQRLWRGVSLLLILTAPSRVLAQQPSRQLFQSVVTIQDQKRAFAVLNGYMKPLAISIKGPNACGTLLGRWSGPVETIYAGVCYLRNGAKIMVCGDTGVGEFALTTWKGDLTPAAAKASLLSFTNNNCGGG